MSEYRYGWHFLCNDWRAYGGFGPLQVGQTVRHTGALIPCTSGLHASVRALDALQYATGSVITFVRCLLPVVGHGHPEDKFVTAERTILWGYNAEDELRAFARQQALSVVDKWKAPQVVLDWLESGDEALQSAAESAARYAAQSAARYAAWSAAWSAAESAARYAAESAANETLESLFFDGAIARGFDV